MATTLQYDDLVEAAYNADLDPDDTIRPNYSGRAMYGKTCLAIIYDDLGDLLRFIAALDHGGVDLDWLGDARQDSMGLGAIAYWPGVTVEGAPTDDDDDDDDD